MNETYIIDKYFRRQATRAENFLSIGDDCALLNINENTCLATSTDTLVAGVHFLKNINPKILGERSLAVNLSDLAAMAAKPIACFLSLTLPAINEKWLSSFSQGFFHLLDQEDLDLVGGNLAKGPLSITICVQGIVNKCYALSRSKAKIGDCIWVTGTLGDSAAGLNILTGKLKIDSKKDRDFLVKRHLLPTARVKESILLTGIANAAIDISDGLAIDLSRMMKASKLGCIVYLNNIPYSSAFKRLPCDLTTKQKFALEGGEDYELCFTAPKENSCKILNIFENIGVPCICIGEVKDQDTKEIIWIYEEEICDLKFEGFDHFK